MSHETVPAIVLGGTGYVAGEFLRLIAQHPRLRLGGAVSTSLADQPIGKAFAHLGPIYPSQRFVSVDAAVAGLGDAPRWVVVSAAPHGASAPLVAQLLTAADAAGVALTVVDASADFRFRSAAEYDAIYEKPHAAPALLESFRCAVPEHLATIDTPHAAQPGCFATAMLLAIVPLIAKGIAEPDFSVSAITGSTGAGGTPRETTHHPVRQSNVFAYQALKHRHDPEVRTLAETATKQPIRLHFVPHSGPFARGIHATVFARRATRDSAEQIRAAVADFYRDSAFVEVLDAPPRMKDIVGTNFARLSVAADDDGVAVCCVIDNLVKGASGGAMQWVNRLNGWPETEGLMIAAAGWI
jgi:N-acetyl-gamma-glutamyl-phosphate reductase common form